MPPDATPERAAPLPCLEKIVCEAQPGHGDTFKAGFFAGVHGDELAGTLACHELLRWAREKPAELAGFELHFYPVCNPTGIEDQTRHCRAGLDLNREFWKDSAQPEVIFLEAELRRERYDAIIALHADDTSDGCYGFVRGHAMTEHILEPALQAAEAALPRNHAEIIDGFPARRGIIAQGYTGILSAPPGQVPQALEIVFETPALAEMEPQVLATVLAVKAMLRQIRLLQAYAANL